MSRIDCHIAPDRQDLQRNASQEPMGERLRVELEDWLERNHVVSVVLDTDKHVVQIDSVKLPPEIKPVLTLWGSIFVEVTGYDMPARY